MNESRLKRLQHDYNQMLDLHQRNGLIYIIATEGNPPEHYHIGYRCRGVESINAQDQANFRESHEVEIVLTLDYPRVRPLALWKTPNFHPNFANGAICWEWYSQQTLRETCEVFAEMVQYKNYNSISPLNTNASMWVMRHRDEMPVDKRDLFTAGHAVPPPIVKNLVVTGFVPIMPAAAVPSTAVNTTLAPFCSQCGREFSNTDSRFCPKCGAERPIIALSS